MRRCTARLLVMLHALLFLGGCAGTGEIPVAELERIVSTTDWTRTIPLRVVLRDAGITPREVRLKVGQPYRLTLENQGAYNHYFNAPEFYSSIAVHKAQVNGYAEIKARRVSSFELFAAGGTIDVYFVPLAAGRYRAHCHLGNHAEMGVEAVLIVE